MSNFFWGLFTDFLWSLPGRIIDSIGWSGVAVLLAGGVLLLSLSARAVKLMTSPRAMVVAALALGGFVLLWCTGPKAGKLKAGTPPATAEASSHKVVMPPVAKATVKPPPEPLEMPLGDELPLLASATPQVPVVPATVPAVIPPIILPSATHTASHPAAHQTAHHAAGATHHAATTAMHHQGMVAPAPPAHPAPHAASPPPQTAAVAAHTPAVAPMCQRLSRQCQRLPPRQNLSPRTLPNRGRSPSTISTACRRRPKPRASA